MKKKTSHSIGQTLFDLWCLISVIGIWPRYIEPNILQVTKHSIRIDQLPKSLDGLTIAQFSDLHINQNTSPKALKKLSTSINALDADIVVFTGDFLCYGLMEKGEELRTFLKSIKASHGLFAILGNHDYDHFVSLNEQGDYDIVDPTFSAIGRGLKRLFKKPHLTQITTERAKAVKPNVELVQLLQNTPFTLLDNKMQELSIRGEKVIITGLGEYSAQKMQTDILKQSRECKLHIVLEHNPDGFSHLKKFPGDLYLSGHSHGGQINLPLLWNKFTVMENPKYKSGMFCEEGKTMYVNKGIGGVIKFRWFALPEISLFTIRS